VNALEVVTTSWRRGTSARAVVTLLTLCGAVACSSDSSPTPTEPPPDTLTGPPADLVLGLQQTATGLVKPSYATAPSGDARLFITQQTGAIRVVKNGSLLTTPFLDLTGQVKTSSDDGLLSMAFHPQYASNGFFYVWYTDSTTGDVIVKRFTASPPTSDVADPGSGAVILDVPETSDNKVGGGMIFGLDGKLYIGLGDGDHDVMAPDSTQLYGKILRIDVDAAQPYAVPPDNPFVGMPNARSEIWAKGFRQPYRFSFDSVSGAMLIGEVGGSIAEEVDAMDQGQKGLDFGWPTREGTACALTYGCSFVGFTDPILEYPHGPGGCSAIVGGFVYRGTAIPGLQGSYLYSDVCRGFLRSFVLGPGNGPAFQRDWPMPALGIVFGIGHDSAGELYLVSGSLGTVFKIVKQ
jgi:glucose/arabinose dehydrogenase